MWGDEVLRASYILVPAIQSSFVVEFVLFESLPLCFLLLNMSGVVTTVKRRRLAELAGTRFVSESALSQLLSRLGVTGATTTRSIHRHVEADAAFLLATIDVPCKDGSVFRWKVVDPVALINWFCKYSPGGRLGERPRLPPLQPNGSMVGDGICRRSGARRFTQHRSDSKK